MKRLLSLVWLSFYMLTAQPQEGIFVEFKTNKGDILAELYFEKTPVTVANFVSLAEGNNTNVSAAMKGKKFYNGLKFHRVIKDFMIQGGDPTGTGQGEPGYRFKDEITDLKHNSAGILSMANSGPKTNGSQFFITHKETPWLDGKHTVFGKVIKGQEIVDLIEQNDVMLEVNIKKVGKKAKSFDAPKVFANHFKAEEEAAKQAELAKAKEKQDYLDKHKAVIEAKLKEFNSKKAQGTKTDSGLVYHYTNKGGTTKPKENTTVYIKYAGYFEDGRLFDSNMVDVAKAYGMYDQNRENGGGYKAFGFPYGNKQGLIPGFLEALELLKFNDTVTAFIPANLGYGANGAGEVIPPNSNLIFELEVLENQD